jgi:hypothetical protein
MPGSVRLGKLFFLIFLDGVPTPPASVPSLRN